MCVCGCVGVCVCVCVIHAFSSRWGRNGVIIGVVFSEACSIRCYFSSLASSSPPFHLLNSESSRVCVCVCVFAVCVCVCVCLLSVLPINEMPNTLAVFLLVWQCCLLTQRNVMKLLITEKKRPQSPVSFNDSLSTVRSALKFTPQTLIRWLDTCCCPHVCVHAFTHTHTERDTNNRNTHKLTHAHRHTNTYTQTHTHTHTK